jgi:Bacterial type II/III secretion system short domain/Bacterial type II and III secretion system protein
MCRCRFAAVLSVAVSLAFAPWFDHLAAAQDAGRPGRAGRSAVQRRSSPFGRSAGISRQQELERNFLNAQNVAGSTSRSLAQFAAARQTARSKPVDTRNARQVRVEVLFLEIVAADATKAKLPKLSGKAADVGKALADLKLHGQLKSLQRFTMSALHGQKSTTQIGDMKAVAYGTMVAGGFGGGRGGGRVSRSYQMRSFGTMLSLTPSVEPAGSVTLDLNFEQSGPVGDDDSPKEPGETTAPSGSRTISFHNTVRVPPGEFVTVTSSTSQAKKGSTQILVLATAQLDPIAAKPAVAGSNQVTVFHLKHAMAATTVKLLHQLLGPEEQSGLTIAADERTNALFVKGDRKSRDTIEALLKVLDMPAKAKP